MNEILPRLCRAVVWLLLSVWLLHGAWNALPKATAMLGAAFSNRNDSLLAARRRVLGDYSLAIEAIRMDLPAGEDYLLVGTSAEGTHFFVHYDLAPRRSPYLGLGVAADPEKCRALGRPPGAPRYAVVIRGPDYLPRLQWTDEFFQASPR